MSTAEEAVAPPSAEAAAVRPSGEQTMSYIDGKCWFCECGSNVQTKMGGDKLRCNGCGAMYIGVAKDQATV